MDRFSMNDTHSPNNPASGSDSVHDWLLSILDATTDLVDVTDLDYNRFLYLNKAARERLGIDANKDLSKLSIDHFQPTWARELIWREAIPEVLRAGVWTGETCFLSRDRREIAVSQLILAHQAPDGTIAHLCTIARDMTDAKRAQEAVRRSEQLFRVMTENATELIALVDTKGNRLYNSPSYQSVLGYSPDELQGTWSMEQTHPDDRAKLLAAAAETNPPALANSSSTGCGTRTVPGGRSNLTRGSFATREARSKISSLWRVMSPNENERRKNAR
jgi:PAS domain-containing protein